jgi:hypothetical protein
VSNRSFFRYLICAHPTQDHSMTLYGEQQYT